MSSKKVIDIANSLEFIKDYNANGITGSNSRISTSDNGELLLYYSNPSVNSSTGTVVLHNGGLSINTTELATSYTSGGGITVRGGGAITGDLYIGSSIYVASNVSTNTLLASELTVGNINFTGDLYQNGSIYVSSQWISDTNGNIFYTGGNVSISTTSSMYSLDIGGTTRSQDILATNSTITTLNVSGLTVGNINFTGNLYQNGSVYISSQWFSGTGGTLSYTNGNVGIGTTSPNSKLDIIGDINVSGSSNMSIVSASKSGNVLVIKNSSSVGNSTINFENNSGDSKLYIGYANSGSVLTNLIGSGYILTENAVSLKLVSGNNMSTPVIINANDNSMSVTATTESVDIYSGALKVSGGASIEKTLYVGDDVHVSRDLYVDGAINGAASSSSTFAYLTLTSTDSAINLSTGSMVTYGGITIQSTEDALSVTEGGSILTAGGGSIGKSLYVGQELYVNGVLYADTITVANIKVDNITMGTTITELNLGLSNIYSGSFTPSNNVTSFSNIVPLVFDSNFIRSFTVTLTASITADTNLYETFVLEGVQTDTEWDMYTSSYGDSTNITFDITSNGEIQYTTPNFPGFVNATFNYQVSQIRKTGTSQYTGVATNGTLILNTIQLLGTEDSNRGVNNGSLYIAGGCTIEKSLYSANSSFGNSEFMNISAGNINVSGNLIVGGTLTTINVTTTNISETNVSAGNVSALNMNTLNFTVGNIISTNANVENQNVAKSTIGTLLVDGDVTIIGPSLQIPTGNIASRPISPTSGQIRYNIETQQFEGYGPGNAWGSLGGVVDIAQTTKILASESPSSIDGNLYFYTIGSERMRISSSGNVGIGTTSPQYTLDIVGSIRATGGDVTLGSLVTSTISVSNSNITNSTIQNLHGSNTNFSNANIIISTVGTLIVNNANITSGTLGNILSTNANVTTSSIGTLLSINANVITGTVGTLIASSATVTNANITTSTIGSLISSMVTTTNIIATNISSTTVLANTYTGGSMNLSGNINLGGSGYQLNIKTSSSVSGSYVYFDGTTSTSGKSYAIGSSLSANPSGSGNLEFFDVTSSVTRMIIASSGNIGINTIFPNYRLDISGSLRATSGDITLGSLLSNNANITTGTIGTLIASNANVTTQTIGTLLSTTARFTSDVNVDGNLQVGNTIGGYLVNFGTSGSAGYRSGYLFGDGANMQLLNQQVGFVSIATNNGSNQFRIVSSGNVGINVEDPTYRLDVAGSLRVTSGDVTLGSLLVQTANVTTGTVGTLIATNVNVITGTVGTLIGSSATFTNANVTTSTIGTLSVIGGGGLAVTNNISSAGLIVGGNGFVLNGEQNVTNITPSTSTTTGAVRVSGGVGIGGSVNVGGTINAPNANVTTGTVGTLIGSSATVTNVNVITGTVGTLIGSSATVTNANVTTQTTGTSIITGNIGIGTASPENSVHVFSSNPVLKLQNNSGLTNSTNSGTILLQQTNNTGVRMMFDGATDYFMIQGLSSGSDISGNVICMNNANGHVGLGTVLPNDRLHLATSTTSANIGTVVQNGSRQYRIGIRGDTNNSFVIQDDTSSALRMVINTAGNVGFGASLPGSVVDARGVSTWGTVRVAPSTSGGEVGVGFFALDDFTASGQSTSGNWLLGTGISSLGTSNFGLIRNTTSIFAISTSGNLGMGTTSPSERLHVNGNICVQNTASGGTDNPHAYINFVETDFSDRFSIGCDFSGGGNSNTFLITSNTNGSTPLASDAKVSVTMSGNMTIVGDITAFGSISDMRFKKDIESLDMDTGFDIVNKLRPVTFTWNENITNISKINTRDIGFIAQEVEEITEYIVDDFEEISSGERYKKMKHERLIPYLVLSIQKLNKENEKKNNEIENLKTIIKDLLQKLD